MPASTGPTVRDAVKNRHDRREHGHECKLEIETGRTAGSSPQKKQKNGEERDENHRQRRSKTAVRRPPANRADARRADARHSDDRRHPGQVEGGGGEPPCD
jgi:hypothetical protein